MWKSAENPTHINNAPLQLDHVHGWLGRKVATRSGVEGGCGAIGRGEKFQDLETAAVGKMN